MSNFEVNYIFRGEVAAIQNYGAFVKIPGCKQQGLIHKSQVSATRIDDVADVLQRGEHVWCKIISVDDGKIGLSMKVVNQGNGSDLDPSGIETHRDEQKRKSFGGTTQKKVIELEAVLNTTCTKCGTKGHLAKDCFATPDGKKYELLPEIEDDIVVQQQPPPPPPPPSSESKLKPDKEEKKAESKKLKKRKKSKKSKHKSESSSDNNSNEDERKKKKKKKKHSEKSKRKKRKHSESSSDESSDSVAVREKHSKKCKHSKSKHSD